MTDELQIESSNPDPEAVEESATSQPTEPEKQDENSASATETPKEDKSNVQGRINKITAEKYALQRELEEYKKKFETQTAPSQAQSNVQKTEEIAAPSLPDDIYDEDAMRKYHADMLAYSRSLAEDTARKSVMSTLDSQKQKELERTTKESHEKVVQTYAESGLKSGLTIEQMQLNEQVLNGSGINADLGWFIMNDEKGALIANHLANNPEQLAQITAMHPTQAAAFIASAVKPSISGPKTVTSAPDPVESITGGGAREVSDFDRLFPNAQIETA